MAKFVLHPPALIGLSHHQYNQVIGFNNFEKLLVLLVFPANLKEKHFFVQKWQHFVLFKCFLKIKYMTCLDKIVTLEDVISPKFVYTM